MRIIIITLTDAVCKGVLPSLLLLMMMIIIIIYITIITIIMITLTDAVCKGVLPSLFLLDTEKPHCSRNSTTWQYVFLPIPIFSKSYFLCCQFLHLSQLSRNLGKKKIKTSLRDWKKLKKCENWRLGKRVSNQPQGLGRVKCSRRRGRSLIERQKSLLRPGAEC